MLIVDDDELTAEMYSIQIEEAGLGRPIVCTDSRQALDRLAEHSASVALLDLNMPHVGGLELLSRINEQAPEVTSIVITVNDDVDTAVECMKHGAFDFLSKPVDQARLVTAVRHALRIRELEAEVNTLSVRVGAAELSVPEAFSDILTSDPAMYRMFAYIEAIAASPKSVLISGESGSGKELVARAVHRASGRAGRFVPVNVSGLDEAMVSDTLFGHTRGAYTGAESGRHGLIEQATDGTLFLDEIGDMAINAQLKLLRLLQEQEYYPLGSDVPRKARVRIVAATNADLEQRQREGSFRRDLYYRLLAHSVRIPPLRERKGDIQLLVDHFVTQAAVEIGRAVPVVPQMVYSALADYEFPGNVRELQSLLYDAVSLTNGSTLAISPIEQQIGRSVGNLPDQKLFSSGTGEFENTGESAEGERPAGAGTRKDCDPICIGPRFPTLREVEDYLVEQAVRRAEGNQTAAARLLGVSQSTLSRRLRKT